MHRYMCAISVLMLTSMAVFAAEASSKLLDSVRTSTPQGQQGVSQPEIPTKQIPWNNNSPKKAAPEAVTVYQWQEGYLFIDNRPGNYYSLEIPCRSCRTAGKDSQNMLINADGHSLQILVVPLSDFTKMPKTESAEAILSAHRNYELSYLGKSLHQEPKALALGYPSLDFKSKGLLWRVAFPKGVSKFFGQMYLTMKFKDRVLVLMGVMRTQEDNLPTKQLLESILKSFRVSDSAVSPPKNKRY